MLILSHFRVTQQDNSSSVRAVIGKPELKATCGPVQYVGSNPTPSTPNRPTGPCLRIRSPVVKADDKFPFLLSRFALKQ